MRRILIVSLLGLGACTGKTPARQVAEEAATPPGPAPADGARTAPEPPATPPPAPPPALATDDAGIPLALGNLRMGRRCDGLVKAVREHCTTESPPAPCEQAMLRLRELAAAADEMEQTTDNLEWTCDTARAQLPRG